MDLQLIIRLLVAWVLARSREPSTWRGIITVAAALGIHITEDQLQHVFALLVAIIGLYEIGRSE